MENSKENKRKNRRRRGPTGGCRCRCPRVTPFQLHLESLPILDGDSKPDSVVALDCEMVGVGFKMTSALGRCSIIAEDGAVLMDVHVIPATGLDSITDYRTRFSGIRPGHMRHALPFDEAVERARSLLVGKRVVGHALENDFAALGFRIPDERVRDTSRYPPLQHLAAETLHSTSTTLCNPSTSRSTLCNSSASPSTLCNPSVSPSTLCNPSTSRSTFCNPSTSRSTFCNPSTSRSTFCNPSTSRSTFCNPSTSRSTFCNPSTSHSTPAVTHDTSRPGRGLKALTRLILGRVIQQGEHDSVEDATAALQLYKVLGKAWESDIQAGRFVYSVRPLGSATSGPCQDCPARQHKQPRLRTKSTEEAAEFLKDEYWENALW